MKFHLGFQPNTSSHKITHQSELLMIGSCFSEHIGNRLNDLKFSIHSNPFGIVFNPKSIETALNRIINNTYFTEAEVFEKDGQWFCMDAHSAISGSSEQELITGLNSMIDQWYQKLKSANYLTITFGSAYAYNDKARNKIVANCHKLPQALFEKTLLDTQDVVRDYQNLIDQLSQFNSGLKLLFTVSPVKHLKDGVVENSLSKAILIQAVHQLVKLNANCFYFPAYELVNDDLRDHRFYEADMAHPNAQAIDYVWQKFGETYFDETTVALNIKLVEIKQAFHHRLFNEKSESALAFKQKYRRKCLELQEESAFLNLSNELNYFSN
ncbi:MAG: GSCFA domain-containing protein [Bacteroidota bacterium]